LLFSEVLDPLKLYTDHSSHMSEDIVYQVNRVASSSNSSSMETFVASSLLFELEKLLRDDGYSLSHFNLPIPDDIGTASIENRLLLDELTYDSNLLSSSVQTYIPTLNSCQKNVFDAICNSVMNKEGMTFFVHGYGGIGKTFLWTTILNFIRDQGKIVLAVASSGIAALLLPRGRTPHSRFKISLDIKQNSMCSIKTHTHILELICQTSLIVWDEAPVNHKYYFETLDRSLRDIVSDSNPLAQNKLFWRDNCCFGWRLSTYFTSYSKFNKATNLTCLYCQILFVAKMHSPAINRKHEIRFEGTFRFT
jgi:hypothetical protein